MTTPRLLTAGRLPVARLATARLATALLATALLAGCGERTEGDVAGTAVGASSSPSSSPSSPSPTSLPSSSGATVIPDDFPLAAGMGGSARTARGAEAESLGLPDLDLCGERPLSGLDTRDRLVADKSGGEAANTRDLVLLASPAEAARAAEDVVSVARACATQQDGDTVTTTEVHASPFDDGSSATLVRTYDFAGTPSPGVMVHHVVPRGNALLVTGTYGEWPDPVLGVNSTAKPLAPTVQALSTLTDPGSASPATPPSPPSSPSPPSPPSLETVQPLPTGLDLMAGLPEDGGDHAVVPQGPAAAGVPRVELCGNEAWPVEGTAGGVRRMVTSASGPEHFDARDLVAYADEEVAGNVMARFTEAARRCRAGVQQVWTRLEQDTGHDSVTMGLTYTDGLGSSVFQVTRVGRVLLLVTTSGEGSVDSLPQQAAVVTRTTRGITRQLCPLGVVEC